MEIATTDFARGYSPPQWLATPLSHPLPVTREQVQDELAKARRSLEVMSREELVKVLYQALSIFDLPDNWEAQSNIYVAALEDIPADLVREALRHVVKTYEYRFPKPASIRKPVEQELSDRQATVKRLETILKHGKFPEPERRQVTEEDKARATAEVDRLFKAWGIERKARGHDER